MFSPCKWLSLVGLMIVFVVVGCGSTIKTSDDDVNIINTDELIEMTHSKKKKYQPVLVDVRPEKDYNKGHLPGAINIHIPDIWPGDPRLSNAKSIIVYGTYKLGIAGAKTTLRAGYKRVYLYAGGLEAWTATGREIIKTQNTTPSRPETGN